MSDKILNVKQTAEYLQISEAAVYRWCSENRLPFIDLGEPGKRRVLRFKQSQLDKLLDQHTGGQVLT